MVDKVIVVKSNTETMSHIINNLGNKDNVVIALDYESHKQLNSIGVRHEIYDKYLNKDDRENINNIALNITTNWHKNKTIQEYLTLNGINFGWLLDQEFHPNLLSIVTTFYSLLKINEKHSPREIIFSNELSDMINTIFLNCQKVELETKKDNIQYFYWDKFNIKYNIGKIPLTLRLPRRFFFILRDYYEKIFIPIFKTVFLHSRKNPNSILLVDFNPSQYHEFLTQLNKKKVNALLLNRKRVSIWNFRSFSIVRKTKSIPVTYQEVLKSEHREEIKTLTEQIIKKLDSVLVNEEIFFRIFSINDKSFWPYIRKYFRRFCVERFKEAIFEMIGSRELLKKYNPSYILHFYDAALQEKVLINQARKEDIQSILVQHGTPYLSLPGFPMLNPIIGTLPLYSDKKMAVWGNLMKEYCMRSGMTENNIIVSGSMRHDEFFQMKSHETDGTILIALGQLNAVNIDNQTLETYDGYEKCLTLICRVLKKIVDREKIVKVHPGDMVFNTVSIEPIICRIDPSIRIIVEADLKKLLQRADVVISIGLTTVLMEANIFEKPTMTLVADKQDYLSILSSGYTELFREDEEERFEKFLNDLLANGKLRKEQIKKGINFVDAYMSNQGHASEYLAEIVG